MPSETEIENRLEQARISLLDMTLRNKLLNFREARSSTVKIIDELPAEVFRILVTENKQMSFVPSKEEISQLDLQEELAMPVLSAPEPKHLDSKLQTAHNSENLQNRLLRIASNARTILEEQGVNTLYLALGFLEWYESSSSDQALGAPLVLIPVEISRETATSPFKIRYLGEDITTNLSLAEKLRQDFGIGLPDIAATNGEDIDPEKYFAEVESSVRGDPRWALRRDIFLGLFSFGKLMMYLDLDPSNWPADKNIKSHPVLTSILCDFSEEPELSLGDDEDVDRYLSPMDSFNVVDADSSQIRAILDVSSGRNMVIVGPPGTGKSQTITNFVAEALARDKTVLFVSEKMAALEVVKRRLDAVGLGDACLELHSHKANKAAVLAELGRTLGQRKPAPAEMCAAELASVRDELNGFIAALHEPVAETGVTPFKAIGKIEELRSAGVEPIKLELLGPLKWGSEMYRKMLELVRSLSDQLKVVGNPTTHPWRGLGLIIALPSDRDDIIDACNGALGALRDLEESLESATSLALCANSKTPSFAASLSNVLEILAGPPKGELVRLADPVWVDKPDDVRRLAETGKVYAADKEWLLLRIKDDSFFCDLGEFALVVKELGARHGRTFHSDYRKAMKALKSHLCSEAPKEFDQKVELLDRWGKTQSEHSWLESNAALGVAAFGGLWEGAATNFAKVGNLADWALTIVEKMARSEMPLGSLSIYSRAETPKIADMARELKRSIGKFEESMETLVRILALDAVEAFGGDYKGTDFGEINAYLESAVAAPSDIDEWMKYRNVREQCDEANLNGVVKAANKAVEPELLFNSFVYSFHEAVLRAAMLERPLLLQFNGIEQERKIESFRVLDKKCIDANRQFLAAKHWGRTAARVDPSKGKSQMSVVESEIRKKRRHKAIRKLVAEAGNAIQLIKPCFMMSPMSIAQFLSPGGIEFDLVIFDEASQVKPEDALGAIARGRQLVVVGDPNQLPPTAFFNKFTGSDDEEQEYEEDIRDYDSILEKCRFPSRNLRIHYRSRHQSLIQFSNNEFYRNDLVLFPSPDDSYSDCGVRFHLVGNAIYDRGRSRRNDIEAKAVANYVMEHAQNCPEMSLGVGCFSMAQRDAIEDALEFMRRADTRCESFFSPAKPEPFFVKNLENIQGDERDVIVLSVGYGKDANGFMSMSFGPINKDGGWRRLNVLVTRSRRRVEVFSGITFRDIDLSKTSQRGVKTLKDYLEFAETGKLDYPQETARDIGSDFQEAVTRELQKHGLAVESEVGVAGFFIDIGVRDPGNPGLYVLGIECDGATYHSARSARDRDRLRQEVLEGLGWTIHRIWSVDWFNNREREIHKALEAYEKARLQVSAEPENCESSSKADSSSRIVRVEETRPTLNSSNSVLSSPYIIATGHFSLPEANVDNLKPSVATPTVVLVVRAEGPIHIEELTKRCSQIWGFGRTGSRIRKFVDGATRIAISKNEIFARGDFLWPAGMENPPIRNRSKEGAPKRIDLVPPEEIRCLAEKIKQIHIGIGNEDLARQVAAQLGIARVSAETSAYIQKHLK